MSAEGRLESETSVGSNNTKPSQAMVDLASTELHDALGVSTLARPIQEMIERMFDGTEPIDRPLKQWEVVKFNPKHVNICVLRAAGFKGSEIAEIMGIEPQTVYTTVGHPWAKKLIKAIINQNGARVIDIRTRIEEYASDLLDETFKAAMKEPDLDKLTKVTFGLLDRAGYTAKESGNKDKNDSNEIKADAMTLSRLARAMEGSNSVDRTVMPTWTPRRPPEEQFEQESGGSGSVGPEVDGGPSRSEDLSSDQTGSHRARGVA